MVFKEKLTWILDQKQKRLGEKEYQINIDFVHSLGKKCDCVGWSVLNMDESDAEFVLDEIKAIESILNTEISVMENIYSYLNGVAVNIMSNHAPNHVGNQIQHIVASTIFFRTVGLIGKCAVDSGELFVPDSYEAPALYAYKYHDPTADTKNVMCT